MLITYVLTIRNTESSPHGARLTGLVFGGLGASPGWVFFKRLSDNADLPPPAIAEIAQGQYKFAYDAEVGGEAAGQIDAGPALASHLDRYIDIYLIRDSSRVQSGIDASGHVTLDL